MNEWSMILRCAVDVAKYTAALYGESFSWVLCVK